MTTSTARGANVVSLSLTLMRRMQEHWARRVAERGIPRVDAAALWTLNSAGPVPMRGLAEQVHVDPTQITAVVDRLEDAGLAARRVHPTDRRIKIVELTDQGRAFLDGLWERLLDEAPPLVNLTDDEVETLERLLATALGTPGTGGRDCPPKG